MFELVPDKPTGLRFIQQAQQRLREARLTTPVGSVVRVAGLTVESLGPKAALGDVCQIRCSNGREISVEVVGFHNQNLILMPLDTIDGLCPGDEVRASPQRRRVPLASGLSGRVIDALGKPLDSGPPLQWIASTGDGAVPNPLSRARIQHPLITGVRAIDSFTPLGRGQRVGIFAGSGVGKSTLLGMIARRSDADINVVALIGERGREVREFLENDLSEEGRARSIVIVATADQPALLRVKAASLALQISEQLRDEGRKVLLMMDSVTRFAMAQREIGLAVGEPPTARGYTPSVFAALPRLLERAGNSDRGSITGIFTVLVEGDDLTVPIADATRSILDGHIVLTRELADRNHWPAIEVLGSISRLNRDLLEPDQITLQGEARELLALHHQNRDLIGVGAYVAGSNLKLDRAIATLPHLDGFLRQSQTEAPSPTPLWELLALALRQGMTPMANTMGDRSKPVGAYRAATTR